MNLLCKTCQTAIPASNINIEKTIAVCPSCSTVFNFAPDFVAPKITRLVDMPKRFSIDFPPEGLHLTINWFHWSVLVFTLFVIFWDGFVIFWYAIALSEGAYIMALCGTFHALIAIGLTYGVIAAYVNVTHIRVADHQLTVRHVPLPVGNPVTLDQSSIKQLYVKQKIKHNKNGVYYRYEVHVQTHDGRDVLLLRDILFPDSAFYVEQQIEKYLGIQDVAVKGEYEA